MKRRITFSFALILSALGLSAQQHFQFEPERPQPGDVIRVTYTPSGDIANTLGKVEAVVYLSGSEGRKADDLILERAGKKYTATITTDTSHNFVHLGFYVDQKFDNNYGEGYYIQLYDGANITKGSYASLAYFHQYYGGDTGLEKSPTKAIAALEKEFAAYPSQKKKYAAGYWRLMNSENKEEASRLLEKEINDVLKAGLADEDDYQYLETLYTANRLSDKAEDIAGKKKEKFPEGKWTISEYVTSYNKENDAATKAEMLATIQKNVENNPAWKYLAQSVDYFKASLMRLYAKNREWDSYRKLGSTVSKNTMASSHNSVAWGLQEKNEDLKIAEELARIATEISRNEWKNPSQPRPDYVTAKNWEKQRRYNFAAYADTYAMVMYRLGEYEKGFALAKEAALGIHEGKDADQNNTYALLAEKVLAAGELKPELEKFVKGGQATGEIKEMLKRIYVSDKKSEEGFGDYVAALEKESYLKMLEELRKSMLNDDAPAFVLVDLDGNKVSASDLRGKVVVVDFWATWCGPCKASFPGMQKMVNKYKDSPEVKFVFIDTWERVENKEKNAADFIESNKYTFHVLMDNDNRVVEQFKVEGIPTKFVLDKTGKIRFKSVGFGGSDDKLISELTAMIEMAKGEKSF